MTRRGATPLPRTLTVLTALVLALSLFPPALLPATSAAAAETSVEQAFVHQVNQTRASQGLGALVVNTRLADVARGWSGAMARSNQLSHRPSLGTEVSRAVTGDWTRVGENVGYTTNAGGSSSGVLVSRLHQAFMNSTGHRANILGGYNQVGVGVVVSGNGTLWVTVNFMQAPVTGVPQEDREMAFPAFSSWTAQNASAVATSPAAVSWSSGRTDLFALDGNGRLLHRWDVNGTWGPGTGWQDLGAPRGVRLVGQPAVASQGRGSINVVARGADDAVWHRYYTSGGGWSSWQSLGGRISHAPAAVSWGSGHFEVYATAPNGQVYQRRYSGGWKPWTKIGGPVSSAPAVTSWQKGRIDLFARGTDGTLQHRWHLDGRWGPWESLGGALLGSGRPEAVAWASGRLDIFVVGTNRQLYRMAYESGFGWQDGFASLQGGNLVSGTSVVSHEPGHLEVFTGTEDGRVWHRRTR